MIYGILAIQHMAKPGSDVMEAGNETGDGCVTHYSVSPASGRSYYCVTPARLAVLVALLVCHLLLCHMLLLLLLPALHVLLCHSGVSSIDAITIVTSLMSPVHLPVSEQF